MTGKGFSFLNIPRSYYGRLDAAYLQVSLFATVRDQHDVSVVFGICESTFVNELARGLHYGLINISATLELTLIPMLALTRHSRAKETLRHFCGPSH